MWGAPFLFCRSTGRFCRAIHRREALASSVHLRWLSSASPSPVSAETFVIQPKTIPSGTIKLNSLDLSMMHFPGVTTHNFFKGPLDVSALKEALGRVVSNNPGLAGRIRSVDESLEVHYEGKIGADFHVRPLPPDLEAELEAMHSEKIAQKPLAWELMVEKLGIANTGPGPKQIDTDGTLCCATYLQGVRISTVSLSVSHLLGDGATKMMTLTAWDKEFLEPGSTTPFSGREAVEATDAFVKAGYSDWEQAAMKTFYPKIYDLHAQQRKVTDYNMVVVRIREATMQKLKQLELQTAEKGTIISAQDALIAWLGNVLKSKWFSFTVDLRGRMKGLELNTKGNAFMTWYGSPAEGVGKFTALDVRRCIKDRGTNCETALTDALLTGLRDGIDVNSWVKLQHPPNFGGEFWKQLRAIGFGSLPFLFRINYHVVYQPQKGEYIMFHFGLVDKKARLLQQAWKELGEECVSVVSGAELLKCMGSDSSDSDSD